MKKLLLVIFSISLLFQSVFAYSPSFKDVLIVKQLSSAIENLITEKWDEYRDVYLERLETIKIGYSHKERIVYILDWIIAKLSQVDLMDDILDELEWVGVNTTQEKETWYIKQVYTDQLGNYKLEIDYIQRLSQNDCKAWGYAEYDPAVPFCIINQNPKLRTFTISPEATIKMQTYSHLPDGDFNMWQHISYLSFSNLFGTKVPQNQSHFKNLLYHVTITNWIIDDIEEQYLP
jgi:hypothetical protein